MPPSSEHIGTSTVFAPGDVQAMRLALEQARLAEQASEVPVGAVILDAQGQLLAAGHNLVISHHDPTAHAEIVALRAATRAVGNYRLPGATLFVTLEPCAMCVGALLHARLARVVYGAADPKTGACASVLCIPSHVGLNHQTEFTGGLLADECGELLRGFFREKRLKSRLGKAADDVPPIS